MVCIAAAKEDDGGLVLPMGLEPSTPARRTMEEHGPREAWNAQWSHTNIIIGILEEWILRDLLCQESGGQFPWC